MNPIIPTVGRIVYFTPAIAFNIPVSISGVLAAIITAVHNHNCINLAVFDANGNHHAFCSVEHSSVVAATIDGVPYSHSHSWDWMPYQKGQAKTGQFVSDSVNRGEPKLETAQDSVTQEKHTLDDNLIRLSSLLQNDKPNFISSHQWGLMQKQESAMKEYSRILGERIILFNAEYEALSPHNTINS